MFDVMQEVGFNLYGEIISTIPFEMWSGISQKRGYHIKVKCETLHFWKNWNWSDWRGCKELLGLIEMQWVEVEISISQVQSIIISYSWKILFRAHAFLILKRTTQIVVGFVYGNICSTVLFNYILDNNKL